MRKYIKLLRIKHYVKNFLIFMPLFFSGKISETFRLISVIIGFICFCAVSSSIYIINDIRDADKDALHPIKKTRPIASGEISKKAAGILAVILASASLIASLYCFGIYKTLYVLVYFILNLAYSLQLKKIALLDICILVSGFIIRTFYGGAIASIDVSNWLYLTILSVSFFFALGKRRNEIKNHGVSTRDVLSYYTQEFLDKNMYVCIGMTNCFYSLWAMSQNNNLMIISIPIVFVLLMRYSLIIEGGDSEGDPTEILLKDKTILLLGAIYVMLMFSALYFK